jgi:deazaflavin-dependent oxidoreductase (nitroreductase family)
MISDQDTRVAVDRAAVRRALRAGGVIDITTHGRKSGTDRRIEIVFFDFDGHVYISGLPGRRGWYANLAVDPRFTFHLKQGVVADLLATARLITDEASRRAILARVTRVWNRQAQLERFVADSPLIEVTFDDPELLVA